MRTSIGILFACVVAQASVARAATIVVTTTADELDANGTCSLREAVQAANSDAAVDACAAGGAADVIVIPSGVYTLTLTGANEDANLLGDLDITTGDVTLQGTSTSAVVIDGNATDRALHATTAGAVSLLDLTIRNGSLTATPARGGCILRPSGALAIERVAVSHCTANTTVAEGGAIYAGGPVSLTDTTIESSAARGASSTRSFGGGLRTTGAAALTRVTIASNAVSNAGGACGGGMYHTGPTLDIWSSTISGNTSNDDGGGLCIESITHVTRLQNTTIEGNSASSGDGGGVYSTPFSGEDVGPILRNVIVAGNLSAGNTHNLRGQFQSGGYRARRGRR